MIEIDLLSLTVGIGIGASMAVAVGRIVNWFFEPE